MVDPNEGNPVSGPKSIDGEHIEPESINVDALSHNPAERVPQSVSALLEQGKAVAVLPSSGVKSIDPRNFPGDAAALQTLINYIEENFRSGEIYFGPLRPDGTQWTIDSTISTDKGSNVSISFHYIGGQEYQGNTTPTALTTSINDGSEMFLIRGDISTPRAISGIEFTADAINLKNNDVTVLRTQFVNKPYIQLGTVYDFRGDAIVFDSSTFQWRLDQTYFCPNDQQTTPTARCIILQNSLETGTPDDGTIDSSVSTETRHSEGFINKSGATRPLISGHWEGAAGKANIYSPDGQLFITPSTTFQQTTNEADHIRHEGGLATIAPGYLGSCSGHAIHIPEKAHGDFKIWPFFTHNSDHSGDTIRVAADPGGVNPCIIPREDTLMSDDVTISYPTGPWNNLMYPDGYSLESEGTTTIPAGGTVELYPYVDAGEVPEIEWAITTDPTVDVSIQQTINWSSTTSSQAIGLREMTGNSSVEIHYRILKNEGFEK